MELYSYIILFSWFIRNLNGCSPVHDLLKKTYFGGFSNTSHDNVIEVISDADYLVCLYKCIEKINCDYLIMCTSPVKRCFLLSDDIGQQDSNVTENSDCFKIKMEICFNGGNYNGTSCECPVKYFGSRCEYKAPVHCMYGTVWSKVLHILFNDTVIYGARQDLYNSVGIGKGLKVSITKEDTEHIVIYNIQHSGFSVSSSIWAFAVENLNFDYLDMTDSNLARHRIEVNSVRPYASEWSMTFINRQEIRKVVRNFSMKWFQENKITSPPCMTVINGKVEHGSETICQKEIIKGADVYLRLNTTKGTSTKTATVLYTSTHLVGYRYTLPAHLRPSNGNFQISKPNYIIDNMEFSNGEDKYLRWRVRNPSYISNYTLTANGFWLIDNCWIETVSISDNGNITSGSIFHLLSALNDGKPIKVEYQNYTSTIRDVTVENQTTVIAMMEDILNDDNRVDGIMIRRMVTTSSLIVTISHILEQNTVRDLTTVMGETRWFVEWRQPWQKILTFNWLNNIVYGSVNRVYNEAIQGAGFRIAIKYSENSTRYIPINIVHVYNSTFIVLETGVISSIQQDEDGYTSIQWDGFLSTDGIFETVKWTTGSSLLQGRTIETYMEVHVFIQK